MILTQQTEIQGFRDAQSDWTKNKQVYSAQSKNKAGHHFLTYDVCMIKVSSKKMTLKYKWREK